MSGIYIHVPFCASRCLYCDFYSTTFRNKGKQFIAAIEREMIERCHYLSEPIRTLYLGGGTPSQLGAEGIRQVLAAAARHFDLSQCDEITMEANPEDFSDLSLWPIGSLSPDIDGSLMPNRISMGVQSMVDSELRLLNRRHDAQRVVEAVNRLRDEGIRNLSLDLMYGLPSQTLETWRYSIERLLELHPEHISAYNLSVEEGTQLHRLVSQGKLSVCDDDLCIEMATLLRELTHRAGYNQYEISNYALPGYHSRHNSSYWDHTPYLGLGPGAHSFDGLRTRSWNDPLLVHYLQGNRSEGSEELSDIDLYNEHLMLGLRTSRGVSLSSYRTLLAAHRLDSVLQSLLSRHLLRQSSDNNYILTPEGLALGDEVIRELMIV